MFVRRRVILFLSSTAFLGSLPSVWSNQGGGQNPGGYNNYNYAQQQQQQQQGGWQQEQQTEGTNYQQKQQPYQDASSSSSAEPPLTERQPPALPPGWTEHIDPSSGQSYYYNAAEGITTWERPAPLELDQEEGSSSPQEENVMESSLEQIGREQQQHPGFLAAQEREPEPLREEDNTFPGESLEQIEEIPEEQANDSSPGGGVPDYAEGFRPDQYTRPHSDRREPHSEFEQQADGVGWGIRKDSPSFESPQQRPSWGAAASGDQSRVEDSREEPKERQDQFRRPNDGAQPGYQPENREQKPGWGMSQPANTRPEGTAVHDGASGVVAGESDAREAARRPEGTIGGPEAAQGQPKPWGMQADEARNRPPLGYQGDGRYFNSQSQQPPPDAGRSGVPPGPYFREQQKSSPEGSQTQQPIQQQNPYGRLPGQGPPAQDQRPGQGSEQQRPFQQHPGGQHPQQQSPLGQDQRPGHFRDQQPPIQQHPYGQRPMTPDQRPGQPMQYPPQAQRPPYQQAQYGQGAQRIGPPYGQQGQYGQYSQPGPSRQNQPGYGQQGSNQMVEAGGQSSAVREVLGKTWQGLLEWNKRTKEVVDSAASTVVSGAKEAGETLGSASASWWGQAKNTLGSVFESGSEEQAPQYSLSQRYGGPPDHQGYAKPPGYPQQQGGPQGYPPQQGHPQQRQHPYQQQQTPPQQQQQPPQQQQQQSQFGRYPPGYTPPQPRSDPAYPHQQSQPQDPRQRQPPLQSQWGGAGGPRQGLHPSSYGQYPQQPGQQVPPKNPGQGGEIAPSDPWQHPGLGPSF